MTPQNLINIARTRYNAEGDTFFSDQMLLDLIYQAESQMCNEFYPIQTRFTTASISGTREYEFPTNTIALKTVRYKNKIVKRMDQIDDPYNTTSEPTGEPFGYTVWDNTIIFFPTPDTDGDTITLYCEQVPAMLTAVTDPLNVPVKYQIHLVDYILSHMALKDNNLSLSNVYMANWERSKDLLKRSKVKDDISDSYEVVRDGYFGSDIILNGNQGLFNDGWW